MSDQNLACRDCGTSFVFTESEQAFFAEKGFTNAPSRCPSCRSARKTERESGGGGSDYSRGSSGYSDRPREMHPAVCAQCGKDTQVPFVPRGDRPVYCSDCFSKQKSTSSYGGGSGNSSYGDRGSGYGGGGGRGR